LPAAFAVACGYEAAVEISKHLQNGSRPLTGAAVLGFELPSLDAQWTPAERVRRHLQRFGWNSLSLSEQRWCLLDISLNPDNFHGLQEQLQHIKMTPALQGFQTTKDEIDRIFAQPFTSLSRRDLAIRKLMSKFHDDKAVVAHHHQQLAHGYDEFLAAKIRAKSVHTYSQEEREWASIDLVLHPEVWVWTSRKGKPLQDILGSARSGTSNWVCPFNRCASVDH